MNSEVIDMYLIRKRRLSISSYTALAAALVLVATEVFASGSGIGHVMGSAMILN
jgi:hypothetical protein